MKAYNLKDSILASNSYIKVVQVHMKREDRNNFPNKEDKKFKD